MPSEVKLNKTVWHCVLHGHETWWSTISKKHTLRVHFVCLGYYTIVPNIHHYENLYLTQVFENRMPRIFAPEQRS